jgi:hypothetical protein
MKPIANTESIWRSIEREDFGLLGDVERRLAGKLDRVAARLLPGNQLRQHLAGGLAVADEVVIDEIHGRGVALLRAHGVELSGDLLRGLQARLTAVKSRNVAELAAVWAAAGKLQRHHHVTAQRHEVIGGDGKFVQRQPLCGLQSDLPRRTFHTVIE